MDNFITELKSIKKIEFSRLQEFHISHNKIKDLKPLERANLKKLLKISAGFKQSSSFQEYKSLLRISAQKLRGVYLNYIEFIEFYDTSLKKRYKYIDTVSLANCNYSTGRKDL